MSDQEIENKIQEKAKMSFEEYKEEVVDLVDERDGQWW